MQTVSTSLFYLCVVFLEKSYVKIAAQLIGMIFTFILIMITATKFFSKVNRMPLMTVTSMRYFACDGAAGGTPEMIKQMEQKLKIAFEPTSCKIVDPVGDMNSIVIKIVSPKF